MATIKAIKDSSVHQIQSGQVIVDLNSVAKELVENSLDAGATSIDIRFKNHGLDSIEVQDNGSGISPDDYETIALKHYTSKLSSYEDLTQLDTFGFRGEALSSLCALSDFHITTAQARSGAKGTKLGFEVSGKLKGTSVVAAQKGTTVCIEDLFKNLPVRRKELEKNIKREYGKVLGLLHAYACISVGVRFSVSNQMPKGKKVAVFSTKGNPSTKENIVNVYGAKTLIALVKLDLKLEMQPSLGPSTQSARNWATQNDTQSKQILVQGHISRPVFGEGRQAPDRQMFFVNSRPCALPQVSKAFNEVYKSFNVLQSPFVFANLIIDTNAYDVNVSPDKRTILLHDQTALLESLKVELGQLFESVDQSVPASQLLSKKLPAYQPLNVTRRPSLATEPSQSSSTADSPGPTGATPTPPSQRQSPANLIHQWVGRDAESRHATPVQKTASKGPSKDKQKLVRDIARRQSVEDPVTGDKNMGSKDPSTYSNHKERAKSSEPSTVQQNGTANGKVPRDVETPKEADPLSSAYDDLFSQRPPALRREVQDFNARLQSQQAKRAHKRPIINTETADIPDEAGEDGEQSPTSPSLGEDMPRVMNNMQHETPGPLQNAFNRMRASHTPGDAGRGLMNAHMTSVESPDSRKRRVYNPKDSQSIAKFGASPLLARSLKRFAAPSTQLEDDSSDEEMADAPSDMGSQEEQSGQPQRSSDANLMTHTQALVGDGDEDDELLSSPLDPASQTSLPNGMPTAGTLVEADDSDDEYLDEEDKKLREDAKVARMIQEAEKTAAQPTDEALRRASQILGGGASHKDATLNWTQSIETSIGYIEEQFAGLSGVTRDRSLSEDATAVPAETMESKDAESKLSLTISKSDFLRMRIVGQFNLGFILAVRPSSGVSKSPSAADQDHIFIIDQHAADEKYNFERLTQSTTLNPQRLVQPKPLQLTAVEEEIILANSTALVANGFELVVDESGNLPMGQRCSLLSLPTSRETTFTLSDLEELIHLLSENVNSGNDVPRPTKVRKMLAMRACRSSIMVGKTLQAGQMDKVVRHMGEMEKPWNCPHGRPTMRHLAGLGQWCGWNEDLEWENDEGNVMGGRTDWGAYVMSKKDDA